MELDREALVAKYRRRCKAVTTVQRNDLIKPNDVTNSVRSLHLDDKKDQIGKGSGKREMMEVETSEAKAQKYKGGKKKYRIFCHRTCPFDEYEALEFYISLMSVVMGSRENALSVLRKNLWLEESFIVLLTKEELKHLQRTLKENREIGDKVTSLEHYVKLEGTIILE